ncbi:Protein BOI2 [Paramyrothecium foliicola]|nr:Protein BOI2 [Paramyrothecium foliicola]
MASRPPNEGQVRPEVGDTLTVVHDFLARSSDELSLAKGDRVELIERDDEFGDGWFLGRHLANGNTGLFPEVYTRPLPKTAPSAPGAPTLTFTPSQPLTTLPEVTREPSATGEAAEPPSDDQSQQPPASAPPKADAEPVTLPLNSTKDPTAAATPSLSNTPQTNALGRLENSSQDSQVLSETLNVINEHITDLRSPSSNSPLRVTADSGSEYSASIDHRASYIQGEETDEEDEGEHSRAQVEAWTADQVAEYLFTSGVEKQHCEVFRDQEITGEVLLGMDQSSIFLKAFDLGSVGRRLKTWQKIKALQDEANGLGIATRRTTQTYGSEVGSEDGRRSRPRTSTLTHSVSNPPLPSHSKRLSLTQQSPSDSPTALASPTLPQNIANSPTRPNHAKRPSAASIRDIAHSRRHSSTDFRGTGIAPTVGPPKLNTTGTFPIAESHKKQPSFDRNWTLGSAISQSSPRPLSSAGLPEIGGNPDPELQDSAVDLERGYFSGNEVDGRKRNVLRKRSSTSHSRKSSYAEEQRVRSATAISRHSRFGSIDSTRDVGLSPAAQKYYGIQPAPHRRRTSTNASQSILGVVPPKDVQPPTVTRLDGDSIHSQASASSAKVPAIATDWPSFALNKPLVKTGHSGMRVMSDTTGNDSLKAGTPVDSPSRDSALDSPSARTGSTTPSGDPSFELDSPDTAKSPSTVTTSASKNSRKKGKKETSAYTRGLQKIGPREAMKDADYSGWMRKKSSNLMTTWKPRFFVLKGRRLSYYYTDDDQEEKGLIDISFHRVLPADNEKLTGLHATITGAVSGPALPNSQLPGGSESAPGEHDSMFIFKLVPPRAGLSRAVTFTKPTVHYFAVPNLQQGRLWMAALMKATIDRDDTKPVVSTYQPKTISLAKARQMRHRPPALMNLDEANEEEQRRSAKDPNSLGILGEADSGVSGMDKHRVESARLNVDFGDRNNVLSPQSA